MGSRVAKGDLKSHQFGGEDAFCYGSRCDILGVEMDGIVMWGEEVGDRELVMGLRR
jgi:hypothetical protein